jgi:hypothetical protein
MSGVRRRVGVRAASSSIGELQTRVQPRRRLCPVVGHVVYVVVPLRRSKFGKASVYGKSFSSFLTIHSLVTRWARKSSDLAQRVRTYRSLERRSNMLESREGTSNLRKLSASTAAAVDEITNPSAASATGNRELQNRTSPERATDKRLVQRHANAMKARTGHRRDIRRSNTNG